MGWHGDITAFGDFGKYAEKEIRAATVRAIVSTATRLKEHIITDTIPHASPPPVDRRTYEASWFVEPNEDGADLYNTAPHSVFIEEGVKNVVPGPAMIAALQGWMNRKGMDPKRVWGVITNMKKRGGIFVGGLHILKKAVDEKAQEFLRKEMTREIGRI